MHPKQSQAIWLQLSHSCLPRQLKHESWSFAIMCPKWFEEADRGVPGAPGRRRVAMGVIAGIGAFEVTPQRRRLSGGARLGDRGD